MARFRYSRIHWGIQTFFFYSVQLCALYSPSAATLPPNNSRCVQAKEDSFPLNKSSDYLIGPNGLMMLDHK